MSEIILKVSPGWLSQSENVPDSFTKYINKNKLIGFWRTNNVINLENIRMYCDWFANHKKISKYEDWYSITGDNIKECGGSGFFTMKINGKSPFNESMYQLMLKVYPDFNWKAYMFKMAPQRYYQDINNRFTVFKDFCNEYLKSKEGFETFDYTKVEDLYRLKLSLFENTKYYGALKYYKESFINMLKDFIDNELLPKLVLKEWRFEGQVPKNFWGNGKTPKKDIIMRCFREEIEELGYDSFEKMYELTQQHLSATGLNTPLMNYFNGSPFQLLQYVFPDYDWLFWKFVSAPNNAWDSLENQRKYILHTLNNRPKTDLYNYNVRDDLPHGLTMKYKSLYDLGKTIFPDEKWDRSQFNKLKTAGRFGEWLIARNIINDSEVPICMGKFGKAFKLDFNIKQILEEQLNIQIEIDGLQHFECVWKTSITPAIQKNRDIFKMKEAQTKNLRCIRLLQMELAGKSFEWLDKHIMPLLISSDSLEPQFVTFTDKYKNMYNDHKALWNSRDNITLDDCYPSISIEDNSNEDSE